VVAGAGLTKIGPTPRQCPACRLAAFAADLQPDRFPARPFPAAQAQALLSLHLQAFCRRRYLSGSFCPRALLLHLQRPLQQNPSRFLPRPDMGTNQELIKRRRKNST
jgi:hypothetical protein